MTTLPKRSELPRDQTWDVESIFANETEWKAALEASLASFARLKPYQGRLSESAQTLLEALETLHELRLQALRVNQYAALNLATEGANPTYLSMAGQARSLISQFMASASFIEPELLTIPQETLEAWMEQNAGLAVYRHYFHTLQIRKPFVRSGEVETLLAQASDPLGAASSTASAATNADMKFAMVKGQPLTHATAGGLLVDPDREVRQQAWEAYADGHLAFKNTLTASLQGGMKAYIFNSRARGYGSAIEMSLAQNHIPRSVYDNLLATFQRYLPLWHRYFRIRRRAMGYERLHTFDVPVYDAPAPVRAGPTLSFAEASEMICRGMEPLGQDYVAAMRKGLFEERWVDWGLNEGKRSGAFSYGVKGTLPFIFMSFQSDLFSMSTLAHELGHSMHSYHARGSQPAVYAGYTLFVAEVASNFNQALTRARLLRESSDPDFKLAVLDEAFANFQRYLFTMPTLARFELECYTRLEQGQTLTAPFLNNRLAELFAEGYGGEVEIDQERLGASWMMFGHLYSPFYVYQYATGISAANALAQDVLEQGQPAAQRYLSFLRAGDSMFPIDQLKLAGIDMTSPQPVERAFGVLESLIDQFEALSVQR